MTFDVILDDQVIYVRAPGNYWADEQPVPLPAASDRGAWEPLADPRFADASPLLGNRRSSVWGAAVPHHCRGTSSMCSPAHRQPHRLGE